MAYRYTVIIIEAKMKGMGGCLNSFYGDLAGVQFPWKARRDLTKDITSKAKYLVRYSNWHQTTRGRFYMSELLFELIGIEGLNDFY